ncbi:MAG TPA: RsmG family class I SAM-dependent methyltransferase [Solirubrobacteraceae bacterium]|jgi:16S rRNA (guanine527-N7)-methyltransferase|nr:RsmG family class I SAM-dependent methyltransferase [Solirubrobacteraceae bacterium]
MSLPRAPLTAVAARYDLSEGQIHQLAEILTALAGDQLAPTSVREPARALDVHIADSLVALDLELVREAGRIVDIGAGAGFPGLPLAVALPSATLRLVESQTRKCGFIEGVVASAGIGNAEVVRARVEQWPEGISAHDVVVARAVGPQPVVLEYAAPLLQLGAALVDWRGRRDPEEERSAAAAAELLGLRLESIRRVQPYEGVRDHHLHVYLKVEETPERFPRRAGMARKKPLAA